MWFLGKKGHFCGEIIIFGWWMITFEGPQCMWTNPSQKSRQGSDPPPIPAMPGFWEFLFLEPLPKERTNFTWTVRFAQISLDLDAEIGDLLWFWVIFHICWICVKYLTNIMSEVGLLHLSGAQLSGGPTQRSLKVDSWVPGPNCELHIIHLSYTDLWTISFSVLQRLDWSSIEIFHKATQLLFFQPGQWFPLSMIWCWT